MSRKIKIIFRFDPEHKFMKKRKGHSELVYFMECRFFNNRRTAPDGIVFDKDPSGEFLTLTSRINIVSHRLLVEDYEAFLDEHYAKSLYKAYGVNSVDVIDLYDGEDPEGDEEDEYAMRRAEYSILNRWD